MTWPLNPVKECDSVSERSRAIEKDHVPGNDKIGLKP
jgi:hypothetical protein